jgi:hypothetical protein
MKSGKKEALEIEGAEDKTCACYIANSSFADIRR